MDSFDVLKIMNDFENVKFAPLSNIIDVIQNPDKSHAIVLGIDSVTAMQLIAGKQFVGGLIMAEKEQFEQVAKMIKDKEDREKEDVESKN